MPNWCEGTIKIKGSSKNVVNFMENAVNKYRFNSKTMEMELMPKGDCLKIDVNECGTEIDVFDEMHIEGTTRAFVQPCTVYLNNEEDVECIAMPFMQAWAIRPDEYTGLSKKYGVDIRLYGIECGMQFCQEAIIENGEVTYEDDIQYSEWEWECPFPHMGG